MAMISPDGFPYPGMRQEHLRVSRSSCGPEFLFSCPAFPSFAIVLLHKTEGGAGGGTRHARGASMRRRSCGNRLGHARFPRTDSCVAPHRPARRTHAPPGRSHAAAAADPSTTVLPPRPRHARPEPVAVHRVHVCTLCTRVLVNQAVLLDGDASLRLTASQPSQGCEEAPLSSELCALPSGT